MSPAHHWPFVAWLEVPSGEDPSGWRRVLSLGSWDRGEDLPPEGGIEALADAAAERHGLEPPYRWSLDFNGGARHR